jgi:APA family basic amino acid/polyamine antiporter
VETGTLPNGRVSAAGSFRIPGHPFTTLFFIAACGAVAFSTIQRYPSNSLIGLAIMLSGLPVYFVWAWLRRRRGV